MSRTLRQSALLLLGSFVLWTLAAQANHALAPWQLRLWLGGLLLAPAALAADFRAGALAMFLTGLALDATAPVWFGTHAVVLLAGQATLYSVRGRFAREETTPRVLAALLANLATIIALSLLAGFSQPAGAGSNAGRLLADLILSQLVLALITPWYFAFQARLLASFRASERDLL